MYGLYDEDGILRCINSDREACLDYAKLFEFDISNISLMYLSEILIKEKATNLHLNQVKNNS